MPSFDCYIFFSFKTDEFILYSSECYVYGILTIFTTQAQGVMRFLTNF